jgi:hypothetical protein
MIDPEKYAEEYFNLKYPHTQKEQTTKIYNFNKLPSDKKIVFLKIDILINPNFSLIERFDWDLSNEKKSPEKFSEIFIDLLKDIIDKDLIELNKKRISKQIYSQLLNHIDKNTIFTKLKMTKKDGEIFQQVNNNLREINLINSNNNNINNNPSSSELIANKYFHLATNNFYCNNCNSYYYNSESCLNCINLLDKKYNLISSMQNQGISQSQLQIQLNGFNNNSNYNNNNNSNLEENQRQTERQKILEAKQKNINITESVPISYTVEGKEKKICKKCGEINTRAASECRDCKHKFPLVTHFDINVDQTFSVHFWDKISKNSTIQQLKNFADNFLIEDFCSLKYLYNRVKYVIKTQYEEILTEEAIFDLYDSLSRAYFSLSNTTLTVSGFYILYFT